MHTFIAFSSSYDDATWGEDVPIAVVVRVDEALLYRMDKVASAIDRGETTTTELALRDGDVRWIRKLGYRSDNTLAAIPGFYNPEVDSIVCVDDVLEIDLGDGRADYADECVVFEREVASAGVEFCRFRDQLMMAPCGSINCGGDTYDYRAFYNAWDQVRPQILVNLGGQEMGRISEDQLTLNAMRMVETLARAGIVHPESDEKGRRQILEWARSFDEAGDITQIERQVAMNARMSHWLSREDRDGEAVAFAPAQDLFRHQLAAVQDLYRVAPYVPVSLGQSALITKVTRELSRRAWTQLLISQTVEAPLSVEPDGRFTKLKSHGLTIASIQGPASNELWLNVLQENIRGDLRLDDRHEVTVIVDGEELITSGEVRVTVRNDFMIRDGEDGEENPHQLQHIFTNEGLITNIFDGGGDEVGTASEMYGDIVERFLDDQAPSPEVQR